MVSSYRFSWHLQCTWSALALLPFLATALQSQIPITIASSRSTPNRAWRVFAADSTCDALHRLDLTPDQAARIQKRIKGYNKTTVQQNIHYLEDRLDLSVDQLRTMALAFPPVLTMGLETRLKPAIGFFDETLGSDTSTSRLAAFLCHSPSLLEYNVRKRLAPRLARVRACNSSIVVEEETLRSIATLTDSRFDAWLNNDDSTYSNKEQQDNIVAQQRRPNNEPSSYVVVSNLQSGGNIGNIVRSASIFGCDECLVVGQKRYRLTGDHGSRFDLPRLHMWSHKDARDYLKDRGVRIYGIEIMVNATPIMRYDPESGVVRFPFDQRFSGAAFIFGNEGQGLSASQREICDEFLFIPQTRGGTKEGGGSASMNVACAAAVILQAYSTWAGYADATLEGEKFLAT